MNLQNNMRVKLLIITPTLECGGSEKFVSMVCNHISSDKFSVCLVVVNNSNPFYRIDNPAVDVVDLGKSRVLFSLPAIKKVTKRFAPDIIFSTASHLNLYLAIFKNQFNTGIQFIAREASIVSINSKQAKTPVIYNWLVKKFYKRFDRIICQSNYMKNDLVKNYDIDEGKATVIYNAVQPDNQALAASQKQNNEQACKFITVARLREEKGIERLIHAVGLLYLPFTFYIIGEGNKRNELQSLIDKLELGDKVFLTGQRHDPFRGMEDADVFLMGSYYEGFPNALLEAGALGIPVVAFAVPGGIPEIISNGENGLLVEDNDIIGFAQGIKQVLAKSFNQETIIEGTKKRFALTHMMAEIENIFLKPAPNK